MRPARQPTKDPVFLAVADPASAQSGRNPAAITDASPGMRLAAIDLLRGVAIVAMVIYHTAFDLYADRLIATDVIDDLGWKLLARLTAGTFLLLVGVGLVLATRHGFRRKTYLRRLAFIAGGAGLVTLGTWWFDPSTFVFFGILHEIAVASVLALPFLWLPVWLVAAAGTAIIAVPFYVANPLFDAPALWWVGLSTEPPVTVDYVPVLPWFGVVLAGIVVGRLLVRHGGSLWQWRPTGVAARALMRAGRWSLAIYLIHQPILVGLLAVVVTLLPPPGREVVRGRFVGQCVSACTSGESSANDCTALCGCMFDGLYGTDLFAMKSLTAMSPDQLRRWNGLVDSCQPQPSP
jgi:uncharacterized membrane protein